MVTNKKVRGKAMSMPLGLAMGLGVSMGLTLALAAVMSKMVLSKSMGEDAVGYGAMVTLLLSAALGAWLAAVKIKHRRMVVCLGVGGLYYLTLLACTAMFFGGQYQGMGVTALLVLAGSGAVGLMGLKGEKGSGKRRRKYRPR